MITFVRVLTSSHISLEYSLFFYYQAFYLLKKISFDLSEFLPGTLYLSNFIFFLSLFRNKIKKQIQTKQETRDKHTHINTHKQIIETNK